MTTAGSISQPLVQEQWRAPTPPSCFMASMPPLAAFPFGGGWSGSHLAQAPSFIADDSPLRAWVGRPRPGRFGEAARLTSEIYVQVISDIGVVLASTLEDRVKCRSIRVLLVNARGEDTQDD